LGARPASTASWEADLRHDGIFVGRLMSFSELTVLGRAAQGGGVRHLGLAVKFGRTSKL